LPPPKQKISTNQADQKKKKGHDAEGPPIALGGPNLEGPRGIFPTSLYGQSAPECGHSKFEEFYRVHMNICKGATKCIGKNLENGCFTSKVLLKFCVVRYFKNV
jgi:hypothetical protein